MTSRWRWLRFVGASPERVVLDTNVLLSAVAFGGRPAQLVELVRAGRISGVTSQYILEELRRALTTKQVGISPPLVEALILDLASFMDVVPVEPTSASWVSDTADDPIVETAMQGGARFICTGDRRLLEGAVPGVRILTVAQMLETLAG